MIAELRAKLVTDLGPTGMAVYDGPRTRIDPPCATVVPSLPSYVTVGQFRGQYRVALDVEIIAARAADPADALTSLEALIESVLANTVGDWALSGVDTPTRVTVSNVEYLSTLIHLAREESLT